MSAERVRVDAELLKSMFRYDPATGILYNIKSRGNCVAGSVVGSKNEDGYLRTRIAKLSFKVHRIIWCLYYGDWPSNEINHKNFIRDDNRIDNLDDVDHTTNMAYSVSPDNKAYKNSTTGFRGVSFSRSKNKFVAQIMIGNKRKHLGYFENAITAYNNYKEACNELNTI